MNLAASIASAPTSFGGALAFKQAVNAENLQVEMARKAIELTKTQGEEMLTLLNPQHLGKHVDLKA